MKNRLSLIVTLVVAIMVITGCSKTTNQKESLASDDKINNPVETVTLNVGCSSSFAPYEYETDLKGNKTFEGMNVEIINLITSQLGYKVVYKEFNPSEIMNVKQNGKIDVISGGVIPTSENMKVIDFTEAYFYPRYVAVFKKGENIKSLSDLQDKTISYTLNTSYQKIAEGVNNATSIGMKNSNECIEEVSTEGVDAAIIDGGEASEYLSKNDTLEMCILEKSEDYFALGFPKNSPYFEPMSNKLIELKNNGELNKIIVKYLSEDFKLE